MVETKPLRIISRTEVSKNNSEASLWVIVGNHVYDLTIFLDKHPGGKAVLIRNAGRDVTEIFYQLHRTIHSRTILEEHLIGRLPDVESNQEFKNSLQPVPQVFGGIYIFKK